MSEKNTFYLVREEILPEAIKKTIKVKEILKRGEIKTINEAGEKMGLSRSAYYKYKDHIFTYEDDAGGRIVTLHAVLTDRAGVLSNFMSVLYESGANILTVNQNIPSGRRAPVSVSFRVTNSDLSVNKIISELKEINGVKSVHQILGE